MNGRVTYEFIPNVSFVIERPDFDFNLSSGFLLTGHGSLNAFLHQRRLSDSPECRCGSGEETGKHVLCECPLYDDLRDLNLLGVSVVSGGFDVSQTLSTSDRVRMLNDFARTAFARDGWRFFECFWVTVTECMRCPVSFWLVVGVTSPRASWELKLEVLL